MKISERYKKALVTVAMGLRTENDIKKNGLYRFEKSQKQDLINFIKPLFNERKNLLVLKVKQQGFRSEHFNISTDDQLNNFINNIDNIFDIDNEVWVVSSSAIECWRCRIYLSANYEMPDRFEMAYSDDDHILDHIDSNVEIKYACYIKNNTDNKFNLLKTTVNKDNLMECNDIVNDIMKKYYYEFRDIKSDMELLNIEGISLDCRVNDGYDFHDFDVAYGEVQKVVDFYVNNYLKKMNVD